MMISDLVSDIINRFRESHTLIFIQPFCWYYCISNVTSNIFYIVHVHAVYYLCQDPRDSCSGKFIASAQSPKQIELLSKHPPSKPIIVEGEHYVYLRKVSQKVFVLKTDREGELPGEEPDHYKAMEEEEGEGESQI